MNMAFPVAQQEDTQQLLARFNAISHDLNTPLSCIIGSLETITRFSATLSLAHRDTLMATALAEAHKLEESISMLLHLPAPE
jgi:K+-sensing histidine kinase KdpD